MSARTNGLTRLVLAALPEAVGTDGLVAAPRPDFYFPLARVAASSRKLREGELRRTTNDLKEHVEGSHCSPSPPPVSHRAERELERSGSSA